MQMKMRPRKAAKKIIYEGREKKKKENAKKTDTLLKRKTRQKEI